MASLALISLSMSTVKVTTKQIVINVLIGKTISTKSGMIENDRNLLMVEYSNDSNVVILSFLE